MNPPKFLGSLCDYMYKYYSKDTGKLLVHMGAAGWLLSSAAQILMLMGDRSIDKKKKKFLVPQEGADAAVNITMYYSLCEMIKKGTDALVEKGKILTDEVAKHFIGMKHKDINGVPLKEWKNVFTEKELKIPLTKLLDYAQNVLNPDELKNAKFAGMEALEIKKGMNSAELKEFADKSKLAFEAFTSHKNAMGTVAAVVASVVACNIVTPILRNAIAAKYQKHTIQKENVHIRKEQITNNITMKNPLPSSYKPFSNYNSFRGVKI